MARFRPLALVALVGLLAVGATACGGPDNHYVSNDKAGLYLKIPPTWSTLDLQSGDLKPDSVLASPEVWRVGIKGGGGDATHADFENNSPDYPLGTVEVVPIDSSKLSDGATLPFLRSLISKDGEDPVTKPSADIKVVRNDEVSVGTGYWGSRLTIDVTDEPPLKVTQLALFDKAVHRIYRITFLCSESCFDRNTDQIDSVYDSLVLQGS